MNPRHRFIPWTLVVLLWIGFAAYVWFSSAQLPERVATHFGRGGSPNGWMARTTHVEFTLLIGAVTPAFMFGLFWFLGRLDGRGLNIPHKAYWLAPERRAATFQFIQQQGAWFAGMIIVFIGSIHASIIAANAASPVHLPAQSITWTSVPYLCALAVWVVCFIARFYRLPS